MQVDALAVRLRPRTPAEAGDLGVRLCQDAARDLYPCYLTAFVPLAVLCFASYEIAGWLPGVLLWWSKPWLDRTILFVLSRAAFGQRTVAGDLWRNQKQVWWTHLIHTFTLRRLSPWRSLTQPVYQLEGVSPWKAGERVRQVRQRALGPAFMMTQAFAMVEIALDLSLLSLIFWLAPTGVSPDIRQWFAGADIGLWALAFPIASGIAILFLEPFYVASGFGMYLNRRAELEAWDIEQEFRRVFSR